MAYNYTSDQLKAITTFGSNVLVSAGAGSGKTQVLTERVCHFIKQGYKLDELLLLTFTNLASSEMKNRIRERLALEGLKEAMDVDFASISTFDSYAFSLVKKYHVLLNLDKDIKVVESNIIEVRVKRELKDILYTYYEKEDKRFLKLVDDFSAKDDRDVVNLICNFYKVVNKEINFEEGIKKAQDIYSSKGINKLYQLFIEYVDSLKEELKRLVQLLPTENGYQDLVYQKIEKFILSKDYEEIINSLDDECKIRLPNGANEYKENNEEFKALRKKTKEFFDTLPRSAIEFKEKIASLKDYLDIIIEITRKLNDRIMSFKDDHQVYEFNDISRMAYNLVKDNEDIRLSIKNSLKMIMIDEYQDTSIMQDEFVKLISSDNVFMVGDIKQSIYRFRDAKCEIFIDKYEKYKENNGGVKIDLNTNFRSRSEVLNNINTIFSNIMTLDIGGANYKEDHMIEFGRKAYPIDSRFNLDFIAYDSNVIKLQKDEIEARLIAIDIINKMNNHYEIFDLDENKNRSVKFSDFIILMDRETEFETFIKVFNEYKIPLYVERNENIEETDLVMVLSNIVRLIKYIRIDDYGREFQKAYLSVVRSFIYQKSDEELYNEFITKDFKNNLIVREFKELIDKYGNYNDSYLLSNILFDLDIYTKIIRIGDVEKNNRYLDLFIDMFNEMSKLDYTTDDFIVFLDNISDYGLEITLSSKTSEIDSVRLMNIHKSKGLEFEICYFSRLNKKFPKQEKKVPLGYSSTLGLIVPWDNNDSYIKYVNNMIIDKEEASERMRQLYVALTRTKQKMIILANDEELYNAYLQKVNINREIEDIDLSKVNSLYEFIKPFIYYKDFGFYSFDLYKDYEINIPEIKYNKKLEVHDLKLEKKEVVYSHASHALSVTSDSSLLALGTKLHFIMEIMDFKNPDYSIIEDKNLVELVRKFIESSLLKNVKDAKIYKEYEFFDSNNNINGIIDLMLVYDDHIDIIDYKTKNIDDLGYANQVNIYKNYISNRMGKVTKGYLYSLVQGKYKEV